MKRNLLLSVLMLMFSVSLFAASGKCGDNLTWVLDVETGILTISGSGDMFDYYPWYDDEYDYVLNIKKVIIGNSVTRIGNFAFSGCTGLTSIEIPNSVTSIGDDTFFGCSSLTSITIGNSVKSIGVEAFYKCSSLTSVTIGNSVTSIGDDAFKDCSSLTEVHISDIAAWCKIKFGDFGANPLNNAGKLYVNGQLITDLIIPNSVTSIGNYAFGGCSSLTSIEIPNSVTSIGNSAFSGCTGLTSIEIPNSVTSIGDMAFCYCSSLTSITIPNSVTSIGYSAFWGCSNLTSIEIPNSVTSIENYAFYNCSSLTSVTIPNSVTSIGNDAFYDCSSLTSVTIPNSVTSIGDLAFRGCSSLTSVIIPNSVTSIGHGAFEDCSSLTSVTIGNGVTSIGNCAFEDCPELETVTLGKAIKTIGRYAFVGCKRITDIYCYAERVPDVDTSEDSFKDVSRKAILWVPANRVRNYTTDAYWGEFDVRPMQGDEANTDKVVVKTDGGDAQIIWPKVDGVDSYDLTISDMAGNIICTLIFNADGQLQSIAFKMPAIYPLSAPEQAQSTGFSFTVNGLEANTTYKYVITAKDLTDKVIETYEGTFTTDGNVYDALENVNSVGEQPVRKIFENGRVVIIAPDGKKFSVSGVEI